MNTIKSHTDDPIVITGYARTALGAFQGVFNNLSAPQLGSYAISAAVAKSKIDPKLVRQAFMGCVLSAGLGQAPARQAALNAGLSNDTNCCTINKVCGSAMQAIIFAYDNLRANPADNNIIVAGGMESMSNSPYLLTKARSGYRMGHMPIIDEMLIDGLEDAFEKGKSMGLIADETASKLNISRITQDEFALRSLQLAQQSNNEGKFAAEITPVTIQNKDQTTIIDKDEIPSKVKAEKIPQLKPAFNPTGTVTAANSSSIADGAAAIVMMHLSTAQQLNLSPIAKILGYSSHSQTPESFTTAPIGAIQKLLQQLKLSSQQIDLYEINEAFAVVTLAAIKELNIPLEKTNVLGGSCALGHPIGASGARIICTLLNALQQTHNKLGIASLCIGGGEATAIAIELF